MTKSILIDTDMAIDDWMAICLLLMRSDIDIRAITVAADTQASCEAGVRNAMDLCMLCGKPSNKRVIAAQAYPPGVRQVRQASPLAKLQAFAQHVAIRQRDMEVAFGPELCLRPFMPLMQYQLLQLFAHLCDLVPIIVPR